jgi:hypothetical protein
MSIINACSLEKSFSVYAFRFAAFSFNDLPPVTRHPLPHHSAINDSALRLWTESGSNRPRKFFSVKVADDFF